MRVAFASDHAGWALKEELKPFVEELGHEVVDLGTHGPQSVDYPEFGQALGLAIAEGRAERGVAICGSGIGISIAVNRNPRARAALCHDVTSARLSRLHNDANVIALGARLIGAETARDCLAVFLSTAYEGGRHDRRLAKL